MTSDTEVETSVTSNENSPSQNFFHPDNQTTQSKQHFAHYVDHLTFSNLLTASSRSVKVSSTSTPFIL